MISNIKYSIFDPAGNITALVETVIEAENQPSIALKIMDLHPEVEQVGFVRFSENGHTAGSLRMAGGEFCGNAAACAAALYIIRSKDSSEKVILNVSGSETPVEIEISKGSDDIFHTGIHMPSVTGISETMFSSDNMKDTLPVVHMEGISHIVISPQSVFFRLTKDRNAAEKAVQKWCSDLNSEGLGLMFLDDNTDPYTMTPLVYIPAAKTIFWENSCASGTSAVGAYLSKLSDKPVEITMQEPGGLLRVKSDNATGNTWLYSNTRLIRNYF